MWPLGFLVPCGCLVGQVGHIHPSAGARYLPSPFFLQDSYSYFTNWLGPASHPVATKLSQWRACLYSQVQV